MPLRRAWGRPLALLLAGAGLAACAAGPRPDELTALPSSLLPAVSASPAPTRPSTDRARPAGRSWTAHVTFYGAGDNDPPGSSAIAHPNARHPEAGGTGTYADPVTLASDARELAVGTVVYDPPLKKYFVMEDDCASCIDEWGSARRPHIDLWAGDYSGSAFLACQYALTPNGTVVVELNPPPGRAVDTRPLYGSGGCSA